MRLRELTNLKWNEVDFKSGNILVKNDKSFSTKSKKDKILPMNHKIKMLLEDKRNDSFDNRFVFSKTAGIKFNNDYVSKSFKKAVRASKISEKIHLHT